MVRQINEKSIYYFFFFFKAEAATILDYETEIFVKDIIEEVLIINNFNKKINFTIILDDNPNAYIDQNNRLFISTGLLKYSDSYEAVLGVIAHEIGHVYNFHISKRKNSLKKLKNINDLTQLSVIAGSLISNNSDYLLQSLVTNKVGIQNYYQSFSRDQEREADIYAIETLNKLRLSPEPLVNFLNLLKKKSIQKGITSEYYQFSSHPIYNERFEIINQNSKGQNYYFNQLTNNKFNYIKAKLFGFTEKVDTELDKHLKKDYLLYAQSINLSKKGKLNDSIKILNKLLKKNNNYIYLLETKADILYSNGYLKESMLFYEKIIKLNPDNNYINKKIFNIKFSLLNTNREYNSIKIFNDYLYLLDIFTYDEDLKNKFNFIAENNNYKEWTKYFSIVEKLYNNDKKILNLEEIVNDFKSLKQQTKNTYIKKLIIKQIRIIDNDK